MKKIRIVSCTQQADCKNTYLYKSIVKIEEETLIRFEDVYFYTKNNEGLSKRYNQYLTQYKDDDCIILFVHDDVSIEDGFLQTKLHRYHSMYDIIGVAGGVQMKISEPALWHIMCGTSNLRGFAGHYIDHTEQQFMTNFGPTPSRVSVIDGVFISVNTQSITKSDWRFNENYKFHHYDIASCLDANSKKLKIGVAPIWITHRSHGLKTFDKSFLDSQKDFMNEYKNY